MNSEKKLLRSQMKAIRKNINDREKKEEQIFSRFCSSDLVKYTTFFIYCSFSDEASTEKLISFLKEQGKKVYLPRLEGSVMYPVLDRGEYFKGKYGICEPIGEYYQGDIEVCVLPLLAVDRQGNRLGYGGGYYDRFLKDKNCYKVGYAFCDQLIDHIPTEKFDIKLDRILTDCEDIVIRGENK